MKRNALYIAITAALRGDAFREWMDWNDVMREGLRAEREGAFNTSELHA